MINLGKKEPNFQLNRIDYLVILLFLLLLIGHSTYEVYIEFTDFYDDESLLVVWMEILIVTASLGFVFYIARLLNKNRIEQKRMTQALQQTRQQLHSCNQHLQQSKTAFGEFINWQLDKWQLTQAQKEISILLLKGLSVREIAVQRHVQEKTIRNHLSAIYDKSGMPGRHVFCSYFFEGLF